MSQFILLLFALVILLSAKHYAFDMPRDDAKHYKLHALRFDLDQLVFNQTIVQHSPTHQLLNTVLENEGWLVENGISMKFAQWLVLHDNTSAPSPQTIAAQKAIRSNPEVHDFYKQLEQFYNKYIHKPLNRKLWLASVWCRIRHKGNNDVCPTPSKEHKNQEHKNFSDLVYAKLA